MGKYYPAIEDVFQALADPTRCAIVAALGQGPRTVSMLAEPFEMALPSLMKHLAVLERSGVAGTGMVAIGLLLAVTALAGFEAGRRGRR